MNLLNRSDAAIEPLPIAFCLAETVMPSTRLAQSPLAVPQRHAQGPAERFSSSKTCIELWLLSRIDLGGPEALRLTRRSVHVKTAIYVDHLPSGEAAVRAGQIQTGLRNVIDMPELT